MLLRHQLMDVVRIRRMMNGGHRYNVLSDKSFPAWQWSWTSRVLHGRTAWLLLLVQPLPSAAHMLVSTYHSRMSLWYPSLLPRLPSTSLLPLLLLNWELKRRLPLSQCAPSLPSPLSSLPPCNIPPSLHCRLAAPSSAPLMSSISSLCWLPPPPLTSTPTTPAAMPAGSRGLTAWCFL